MYDRILIFGAGRSAYFLVRVLAEMAQERAWFISLADASQDNMEVILQEFDHVYGIEIDIDDDEKRELLIQGHDVVVSLLPPFLHPVVASDCLKYEKHFLTASYTSDELRSLETEITDKNLIFINELGLDPGLDHMSAKKEIDDLKAKNAEIKSYKSYTGGLVSKESDDNKWHYKISWNPRNVVTAGKDGARQWIEGKELFFDYLDLWEKTRDFKLERIGQLNSYYNRDSLPYRKIYEIEGADTLVRGTFRWPGFIEGWKYLVKAGLTAEKPQKNWKGKSLYEFTASFFTNDNPRSGFKNELNAPEHVLEKINDLGLFSKEETIGLQQASPADILTSLISDKWAMREKDKDQIVMHHEFKYELEGKAYRRESTLSLNGEDSHKTAMARTVGSPLAYTVELVMEGEFKEAGLHIPVKKEIYEPVLERLEEEGIVFKNKEISE